MCIDYMPSSDAVVDPLSRIDWRHIRSLVVFTDAERVPYENLEHLRVLDVRGSEALENKHLKDMCGMLRLRHLLVSGDLDLSEETSSDLDGEGITNQHISGLLRLGHLSLVPAEVERHPPIRLLKITEMPAEIARLQYLETLEVKKTDIRRLPAEIGDLKQLKTLDVSNIWLRELPREMGNLQHLETLHIGGANIREEAWEIIKTLKKLKTLDVSRNQKLSGIPIVIGELKQLKNLDVSKSSGIKELPKEIGKLLHLEELNLSRTWITELPKEIGKLQHLETLNLSRTCITDLPREIGNLQKLEALYLCDVSTITKLPREIGKLQHLKDLDLRRTNVRKIPREIGGLKNLKNLYKNLGTLPFEASQLSKLERPPKWVLQVFKNSDLVSSLAGEILSFSKTYDGDGGLEVGTKHVHIPQWINEHFNIIGSLDIRICKLEEQDLKILREMPYLGGLTLRFEAVPRKPTVISSGGFAKLWRLTVDSRVPRITFQEGAMPNLQYLAFEFQFYGGPPNTDHPMGIKHLVSLQEVRFRSNEWYRADSPCISATIDVMRKEAREHPNEIKLAVSGKDDESFPKNSITQSSQDRNDEACSSGGAQEIEEIQA